LAHGGEHWLAVRGGALAGDAAQTRSQHQLLRLLYCEGGEVEVAVEFAPASTTA